MSRPAPRSRFWFSKKSQKAKRKEDSVRRLMRVETLESRQVLAGSFGESHVAVLFTPTSTAADIAKATTMVAGSTPEKVVLHAAPASYGQLYRFAIRPGLAMTDALAALKSDSHVKLAERDEMLHKAAVSNDTHYLNGNLWGMYSTTAPPSLPGQPTNTFGTQADTVWNNGNTGSSSVVVGVIDEGIDLNHPDLAANIWTNPGEVANNGVDDDNNGFIDDIHGWDFDNDDNTIFDGQVVGDDIDAHGTHVSGTIGGKGGNGLGVAGINWDVKIISAKFLGEFGGTTVNAIRAVDYLTALKNKGINLVASNNSWGGGAFSQLLLDAIGRNADSKMLFIAAAGNFAIDNDLNGVYPTNYDTSSVTADGFDSVISVAAINNLGQLAWFSDWGAANVDIGAPGEAIYSTTPFNTYSSYDGTSMAAPHVTGAAALYYSMNPTATKQQIKAAILGSGVLTPTASLTGKVSTGGRLNLTKLQAAPPPALAQISVGDATIVEGDNGFSYVTLPLSLDKVSTLQSKISFSTANGTALSGSDYVTTTGTVTIAPGQRTGTIRIPIYGDTLIEPNEIFTVNLSNPVNISIADGVGQVTINNDDYATKVLVSDLQRLEGNTGYSLFVFNVNLTQPSASNVVVKLYTPEGTAKDGMDFIGIPALLPVTVTFTPGQTAKTVTVQGIGETLYEPDENFYLEIMSATNAQIQKARGTAIILNDDAGTPGQPPGGGLPGSSPIDSGGLDGFGAAMYYSSLGQTSTNPPATTTKKK